MRVAFPLLLGLCFLVSACTESRSTERLSAIEAESQRAIAQSANQKLGQVKSDEADTAEWTGIYYMGDGTGVNISFGVSRKEGAAYVWHGCLGTYGAGVGTIREAGDALEVRFDQQFGMMWEGCDRLYPVVWGQRHYLIAEKEMKRFCEDVRKSHEPREGVHGMHFLRRGDERLPASGEPRLPAAFRSMMVGTE